MLSPEALKVLVDGGIGIFALGILLTLLYLFIKILDKLVTNFTKTISENVLALSEVTKTIAKLRETVESHFKEVNYRLDNIERNTDDN